MSHLSPLVALLEVFISIPPPQPKREKGMKKEKADL